MLRKLGIAIILTVILIAPAHTHAQGPTPVLEAEDAILLWCDSAGAIAFVEGRLAIDAEDSLEYTMIINGTVIDSVTVPGPGDLAPIIPAYAFSLSPLSYPYTWNATLTLFDNGDPFKRLTVSGTCTGEDTGTVSFTIDTFDKVAAPVPGCDALLPIPASAVGGLFVADAPLYWAPGEAISPAQDIAAGDTARVIGLDASGEYYQIIWVCDFLWVPKDTLAPNPDAVWQGAPLPTDVVE